jgi:hypothetical protein
MLRKCSVLVLLLVALAASGQVIAGGGTKETDGPQTASGASGTLTFPDTIGTLSNLWDITVTGSPTSVSATVNCLLPSGQVSALGTFSSTTTGTLSTLGGPCKSFQVAFTLAGGTSPTLVIYRVGATGRVTGNPPGYIDASLSIYAGASPDATIANAIAAIPAGGAGIVDATKLPTLQTWLANPFDALYGTGSLIKSVTLRLNQGPTIQTNVPIVRPSSTRIEANPPHPAFFKPGPSFPPCVGAHSPCAVEAGTVTTSTITGSPPYQVTVTGNSTDVSKLTRGMPFMVCYTGVTSGNGPSAACAGAVQPNNGCDATTGASGGSANAPCRVWGIIDHIASSTQFVVDTWAGPTGGPGGANATGVGWVALNPVMVRGDHGASGADQFIQMVGTTILTGQTQNMATGGAACCMEIDWSSQESSYDYEVNGTAAGTGTFQGFQREVTSQQSGPDEHMNVTAGNSTADALPVIFRQIVGGSCARNWQDSTVTMNSSNGGAGVAVMFDWETCAAFGGGELNHAEDGSGSNKIIAMNQSVTCPVACALPYTPSNQAVINGLYVTNGGASMSGVNIGNLSTGTNNVVLNLHVPAGNALVDAATGCSSETGLSLYVTTNAPGEIAASSSGKASCQPRITGNIQTKAGGYTLAASDTTVVFSCATCTATLPTGAGVPIGKIYYIKYSGTPGTLTIAPASGNINGSANLTTSTQYAGVKAQWDGTQWWGERYGP